jgi:hypothetical protein
MNDAYKAAEANRAARAADLAAELETLRPGQFPLGRCTTSIEREHPHIVERLRLLWGEPEGLRYLNGLILDMRGDRAGFSEEVMNELFFLAKAAGKSGLALGGPAPVKATRDKWQAAQMGSY